MPGSNLICACGKQVSIERVRAMSGEIICYECGEVAAKKETLEKQKRTGSMGNKMGLQYLGDPATAKRNMLDSGKKTGASMEEKGESYFRHFRGFRARQQAAQTPPKPRPVSIGIAVIRGGDRRIVWAGEDPDKIPGVVSFFPAKGPGPLNDCQEPEGPKVIMTRKAQAGSPTVRSRNPRKRDER